MKIDLKNVYLDREFNMEKEMNYKEQENVLQELAELEDAVSVVTERIKKLHEYVESTGTRDLFED